MFRVKIQVPEEMVKAYIERVKTGVRGVGYVRYDDKAQWPSFLASPVGPPPVIPPAVEGTASSGNPAP
jgi:HlyD family secretion protein